MIKLSIKKQDCNQYLLTVNVNGKKVGYKDLLADNGLEVFEKIEYFLKTSDEAREYVREVRISNSIQIP